MKNIEPLELACLGGLFLDEENRYIETIPDWVFHDPDIKACFEFLKANPQIHDITSAAAQIRKERNIKGIGTILTSAFNATSGVSMLPHHLRQLKELRRTERIYNIVQKGQGTITDAELEIIHELSCPQVNEELSVKSFEELAMTFEERYNKRLKLHKNGVPYPTGLVNLDDFIQGVHKKQLIVIEAGTSRGKTALMTQIGMTNAKKGKKVVMFQCEMGAEQIADRMISNETGLENHKIQYGKLNAEDGKRIMETFEKNEFYKIPFHICYSPKLTIAGIKQVINIYKPDVVIVDHIQILHWTSNNIPQEMGETTYAMVELAKDKDFALILGSQLTEGLTDSYAKGCRAVEEAADTVLILKFGKGHNASERIWNLNFWIKKQRHGPVGSIDNIKFYRHNLTFSEN